MEFQMPFINGNGETETRMVSESEYRQWLRKEFGNQLSGKTLENYIEKRVMDIKYQRRQDVIRY